MKLPRLTAADIQAVIPEVEEIGTPSKGGQKVVYPCKIDGESYALKCMLADPTGDSPDAETSIDAFDEVTARARREVEIMRQVDSPHLVKLGPLPLTQAEIADQNVIYFTEEWIDGDDLRELLKTKGVFSIADVIALGQQVTDAVECLWSLAKIHRDIKPGNIMRRATGEFVLLDMGLAFDLEDVSLSAAGQVPGTMIYFSPEQTEFTKKRQMDFRSDLFSLGIVLYEAATGQHPFWSLGMNSHQALANILARAPDPPSSHRPEMPAELDELIIRLLAKRPHLRYRTCAKLKTALDAIPTKSGS